MAASFPSLSLALGTTGVRLSAGAPRDWRPAAAALLAATVALALALLPGTINAPRTFPTAFIGLELALGLGGLGWQIARLTALPAARGGLAAAALPAALIPFLAVPGTSVAALLPALPLALLASRRDAAQHVIALVVHCGALLAFASVASSHAFGYQSACAILLAGAGLAAHHAVRGAANDNPHMKRNGVEARLLNFKSRVLHAGRHARNRRDSHLGNRGVTNVQQQQSRS